MLSFCVEMLRSEVKWFPKFLSLCRVKLECLKREDLEDRFLIRDNILIPLLEKILPCDSYRQVVALLRRHHWTKRQAIYELRTRARIQAFHPWYVKDKEIYRFHDRYMYNFHNPGHWRAYHHIIRKDGSMLRLKDGLLSNTYHPVQLCDTD